MQYLARIVRSRPLVIHFCLHNPAETNGPVYIPRTLGPLGVFVHIEVRARDEERRVVYEGPTMRFTHRLAPDRDESYQPLESGYTYGVMLEAEDFEAPPGEYEVKLRYANAPFEGTPSTPVGKLTFEGTLNFLVS
jgi:hypothetical protein